MVINDKLKDIIIDGLDKCVRDNEVPVCAVILDHSLNVVSVGINNRQNSNHVLGHAEINAIIDAENKIGDWRLDGYKMVVSLEPCKMCQSVIEECRLDEVYYLCRRDNGEISNKSLYKFLDSDVLSENYIKKLLTSFFNNMR